MRTFPCVEVSRRIAGDWDKGKNNLKINELLYFNGLRRLANFPYNPNAS